MDMKVPTHNDLVFGFFFSLCFDWWQGNCANSITMKAESINGADLPIGQIFTTALRHEDPHGHKLVSPFAWGGS